MGGGGGGGMSVLTKALPSIGMCAIEGLDLEAIQDIYKCKSIFLFLVALGGTNLYGGYPRLPYK